MSKIDRTYIRDGLGGSDEYIEVDSLIEEQRGMKVDMDDWYKGDRFFSSGEATMYNQALEDVIKLVEDK